MKKQRSFFLISKILIVTIFVLFSSSLYASDYYIDTSRGPQIASIPEGMSELDAFLAVSKLYIEERWDHETLLEDSKKLVNSIEEYKESNKRLETLYKEALAREKEITDLYKEKSKIRLLSPEAIVGSSFNIETQSLDFDILFGAELFEKIKLYTHVSYPISIGLSVGVSF